MVLSLSKFAGMICSHSSRKQPAIRSITLIDFALSGCRFKEIAGLLWCSPQPTSPLYERRASPAPPNLATGTNYDDATFATKSVPMAGI